MGTSNGVKLTRTRSSVRADRFWVISGVCRCVPPTPYADRLPITSLPSRCGLADLSGATRAAGRDDDDVGIDEAGLHRRRQRQCRDGRVAPGHGDPPRPAQHVALTRQLGKPVGPGPGVDPAVEGLPGRCVAEPEVGATVDHDRVVAECVGDRGRLPVRQGEHDGVVTGQALRRRRLHDTVGERSEVGLEHPQRLACARSRRHRADAHGRMAEQQTQHLAAGVPGGTGDSDGHPCVMWP